MAIDTTKIPGLDGMAQKSQIRVEKEFMTAVEDFQLQLKGLLDDPSTTYPQATGLMQFLTEGIGNLREGGRMGEFKPTAPAPIKPVVAIGGSTPKPGPSTSDMERQIEQLTQQLKKANQDKDAAETTQQQVETAKREAEAERDVLQMKLDQKSAEKQLSTAVLPLNTMDNQMALWHSKQLIGRVRSSRIGGANIVIKQDDFMLWAKGMDAALGSKKELQHSISNPAPTDSDEE